MRLALQNANAIVELLCNPIGLIGSDIFRANEGAVVGTDFGDVAVFPRAEFGVIVARLCI